MVGLPPSSVPPPQTGENFSAPQMAYAQPVQQQQQQQQPVQQQMNMGGGGAPPSMLAVMRGDTGYYDRHPRRILCQFCAAEVITATQQDTGLGTHLVAMGLCFVGCFLCFWAPYVIDDCKDTVHYCANCQKVVGRKNLI